MSKAPVLLSLIFSVFISIPASAQDSKPAKKDSKKIQETEALKRGAKQFAEVQKQLKNQKYKFALIAAKRLQTTEPNYPKITKFINNIENLVTIYKDIADLTTDPPQLRSTYHMDAAQALMRFGLSCSDAALKECENAEKLHAKSFDAFYYRGQILLKRKNGKAGALKAFEKAASIRSNKSSKTARAHFYAGKLHGDKTVKGHDLKKAIKHLYKAQDLFRPNSKEYKEVKALRKKLEKKK